MKKQMNSCSQINTEACPFSKMRVCQFDQCYLPDNNKRFCFQLAYLFIGLGVLVKNPSEFTFFSLLLYTAPILLDLISTDLKGKLFKGLRIGYIVFNGIIVTFCLLGVFGFLTDENTVFKVVATSLVFPGLSIEKTKLAYPMMIDILIPVVLYVACPNKSMKKVIDFSIFSGKSDAT